MYTGKFQQVAIPDPSFKTINEILKEKVQDFRWETVPKFQNLIQFARGLGFQSFLITEALLSTESETLMQNVVTRNRSLPCMN